MRRVLLETLCVGDDLDNSIPYFIADVFTGNLNESEYSINIPLVLEVR